MTEILLPKADNFSLSNRDTLLIAVLIATLVHVCILFSINFKVINPPSIGNSIDITLQRPALKALPQGAEFSAPNQQLVPAKEIDNPDPQQPLQNQITAALDSADLTKKTAPPALKSLPQLSGSPAVEHRFSQAGEKKRVELQKTKQPLTANTKVPAVLAKQNAVKEHSNLKVKTPAKPVSQIPRQVPAVGSDEKAEESAPPPPRLSADALQQQIAQLGEHIRSNPQISGNAKTKFINSVTTGHKYLFSQYVKDFEAKVQRIGNLNFPAAARNRSEPQTLAMDIGINADGSINSMRIVKSSGNTALDEEAKNIVKMSAPFAELPYDLLHEGNVLVINNKVWDFSDETGMTTR